MATTYATVSRQEHVSPEWAVASNLKGDPSQVGVGQLHNFGAVKAGRFELVTYSMKYAINPIAGDDLKVNSD